MTYHIMPDDFVPPEERSRFVPRPDRNITAALALDPDLVIINLPSNDAARRFSVFEQLANYDIILEEAAAQSVPVWVTTTQPRNFPDEERRENLMEMRDSTFTHFGDFAIDFWNGLALSDGTIDPLWDRDGVHLNDAAHRILFERVRAKNIFCEVF